MPTPQRWKATAWEGTDLVLFDLVKGFTGANITQASLSVLKVRVYDKPSGEQVGSEIDLTISTTIFNTLQSNSDDARYPTTGGGFNFRGTIPGALFADGESTYIVEVIFSDTSTPANSFPDQWEVDTLKVWSR